jgi:Beta protein
VIRVTQNELSTIPAQLKYLTNLNRGAFIRITHENHIFMDQIFNFISNENNMKISFIVDAGWHPPKDILNEEVWIKSVVKSIYSLDPEKEIVIASSSFPDSFSGLESDGEKLIHERTLFENTRRDYNAARLSYGDWGSTRSPQEASPMTNIPRIDLPKPKLWACFRRNDSAQSCRDIAVAILKNSMWDKNLAIWGTYTIRCTAEGLTGGIASPGMATAVRINIHMHLQAQFEAPDRIDDTDEPYED